MPSVFADSALLSGILNQNVVLTGSSQLGYYFQLGYLCSTQGYFSESNTLLGLYSILVLVKQINLIMIKIMQKDI